MDPTVMCELLVGLGDVNVLGVDGVAGEPIRVRVEARWLRPECRRCSTSAVAKDRPVVVLVDLCVFGRPARLVWRKHRWLCPDETCRSVTWTGQEPRIGSPRLALTDRAGRWVTFAGQIRPDRLAVTADVAGDLRDRPAPLLQCMNLHVFLLCQHQGRAPLLAGLSLLTASLERAPPNDGYLLGGGEIQ